MAEGPGHEESEVAAFGYLTLHANRGDYVSTSRPGGQGLPPAALAGPVAVRWRTPARPLPPYRGELPPGPVRARFGLFAPAMRTRPSWMPRVTMGTRHSSFGGLLKGGAREESDFEPVTDFEGIVLRTQRIALEPPRRWLAVPDPVRVHPGRPPDTTPNSSAARAQRPAFKAFYSRLLTAVESAISVNSEVVSRQTIGTQHHRLGRSQESENSQCLESQRSTWRTCK